MKKISGKTPKQARPSIEDDIRDQKRERILKVAEDLFFRQGFSRTTIADIVDHLGVTKPYLYYYFRSKNDIFEALCWRASHACLTAMRFDSNDTRPAAERLHEGLQRFAAANVAYFKSGTLAYRESGALQPAFHRKLRTLARRFYDDLCTLLEQGRSEGALDFGNTKLTGLAIGSIAGFMYTWYKPDGALAPEQMIEELTQILLKIAGKRLPEKEGPIGKTGTATKATRKRAYV